MIFKPEDFEELSKIANRTFRSNPSLFYETYQNMFDVNKFYEAQGPEYFHEVLDDLEDEEK